VDLRPGGNKGELWEPKIWDEKNKATLMADPPNQTTVPDQADVQLGAVDLLRAKSDAIAHGIPAA